MTGSGQARQRGRSYLLGKADLVPYIASVPRIAAMLGNAAGWDVEEVSLGNVNHVYVVRGSAGGVCVKQAPPYVRAAGPQWPLSPRRVRFEWKALLEHRRNATRLVPEPLHYDPALHLMVVEYLDGYHLARDGLVAGRTYAHLARGMGEYLATTLFHTSDFGMRSGRKRALVAQFERNASMCDIMENMVFTEIFMSHPRNQWTRPWLDACVEEIRRDSAVKLAAARLKLSYMTCKQALLHGDLHTGSIMTNDVEVRVIDHEFACFGPIAYDVGTLLAHLLISYFARDGQEPNLATRERFQSWLLEAIIDIWVEFRSAFTRLWETSGIGDAYPVRIFGDGELGPVREEFMRQTLADTVQFCAVEILRRVIGFASVADFTTLPDESVRAVCERRSIVLARTILSEGYCYPDLTPLTDLARKVRQESGAPRAEIQLDTSLSTEGRSIMFKESVLKDAVPSYRNLTEYFRDVRALFELINVRLAIPEYGTRLCPVGGARLHSNSNAYMLYDDSDYPFYLWLPSWLGRFYIDSDRVPDGVPADECLTSDVRLIAFVWPWLGVDDAYVEDAPAPECWIGVAEPRPADPDQRVVSTADMIFKHFRIARSSEPETDGWIAGRFEPNGIGCDLQGSWFVRRMPLATLNSYYEIERNVICPLGERFSALGAEADGARGPSLARGFAARAAVR